MFPLPDDYGIETRVAPITGLNGRDGGGSLIQPLYKLHFFDRPDGTPVTFFAYQSSEQLPSLPPERRDARIKAGAIPWEDMEKEARTAGAASLWAGCATRPRRRSKRGRRWRTCWTRRPARIRRPPRMCATCCGRSTRWRSVTPRRRSRRPRPRPRRRRRGRWRGCRRWRGRSGRLLHYRARTVSRDDALKTLETIATLFPPHRTGLAVGLYARRCDPARQADLAGTAGGGGARCQRPPGDPDLAWHSPGVGMMARIFAGPQIGKVVSEITAKGDSGQFSILWLTWIDPAR